MINVLCCTDIAVIVFNNCTSDNNGEAIPTHSGGTEGVVTRDSSEFKVTFDYEFLEDFCEKKTNQGVQERIPGGKQDVHSEGGFYEPNEDDEEEETVADEADGGLFPLATKKLGVYVSTGQKPKKTWGPVGFNKDNHPLNIMVCVVIISF